MSLRLHFLRHGQTPSSRDDSFCGSGLDPELTPEGARMAQAFADAYRTTAWAAVYTSPLRRTVATARPLCGALGLEPELRDDLKEIGYGAWEGKSKEEVERAHRADYVAWLADPAWHAPTGGELAAAVARRAQRAVEEIWGRYGETGDVLVVSHKATIRIALCALLGIEVGRFRYRLLCPVGSVSVVELGAQGPLLRSLADRSHLDESLRSLPGT